MTAASLEAQCTRCGETFIMADERDTEHAECGGLAKGTKVKCVDHAGAHTGTVVHDLQFAYAVAWRGYEGPTKVDSELAKAHRYDFTYVEYDKVVVA